MSPIKKIKNSYYLFRIYKYKSFLKLLLHYSNIKTINKIELKNGLKYVVDLRKKEESPIAEIYGYNSYKATFNKKNIEVILDVGSNVGIVSCIFGKMYDKAKVYSFEPNKSVFKKLKQNLKINNIKNVKPFNLGLMHISKKLKLYLNKNNSLISSTNKNSVLENNPRYKIIECIDIAKFIEKEKIKFIDIIKLDCEGSEYNILKKLKKKDFLKNINFITMDVDSQSEDFANIIKLLEKNDFSVERGESKFLINAKNNNFSK